MIGWDNSRLALEFAALEDDFYGCDDNWSIKYKIVVDELLRRGIRTDVLEWYMEKKSQWEKAEVRINSLK